MGEPIRVLLVDDSESDALLVLRELRRGGFDPVHERVDTPESMRAALETSIWDAIICDYTMPQFSGPDALKLMRDLGLDWPFIIVSGTVSEETAVEMLKAGAHDFIVKDNLTRLVPAIRREIEDAEVRRGARLAQAILEESEARFHTLARVSPVGIFQTDAEGKCLYVNEQWTVISGLSQETSEGDGWLRAIHPEDRQRVESEWRRCAADKVPFVSEYRIHRPDGAISWVLERAEPQLGDSGQITSFIGTVTDVTCLKLTEESLRRSEADLRERVKELKCLFAVSGVVADSERSTDQVLAEAVHLIPPGWQYPEITCARIVFEKQIFATDNFRETPWRLFSDMVIAGTTAGSVEVGYLEERPAFDEGPFLKEERALINDLARQLETMVERNRARIAVQSSERRFRSLMENSSDFIVVLNEQGVISYASPSLTRTAGYVIDDVVGRHLSDFIHPEDAPIAQAEIAAVLADSSYTSFTELRYRHKDGRWIVLAAASKNVLHDPAVAGIVVNVRDVTERYQVRERLRLANEVVENSPTVLYRVRGRGEDEVCEYVSQNVRQFGYSAAELTTGSVRYRGLIQAEDRKATAEELDRQIASGAERCRLEYRIAARNGELRWIEDEVRFERRGDDLVCRQGILRDVTERKHQQFRIARLSRIRAVLSGINNVIVRVRDETALVEDACRIATEQGGFLMAFVGVLDAESGELRLLRKGVPAREFCDAIAPCLWLNGEGCRSFAEVLQNKRPYIVNDTAGDPCPHCRRQTIARGVGSYVLLPLVVDQVAVGLMALYSGECGFFDDEELELLSELAADVAFGWDHIAKDRKVSYLALYDPLTGLANRTLFAERLSQQLRQLQLDEGMTGLGIVEVERFHNINDMLGWHAGDLVLKTVAERLKLALGEASVARTDADCFSIAVGRVHGASEVLQIFERALRDCFGRPFVVGGTELRLSGRCGIALFPNDGADADTVQKNAAVALKKAKDSAERVLFYAPEMNARVGERMNLETRLHQALEQEQFVLHYQPKFDSKSGSLTGLEALIRWNDPQRGLVPPGDFIPLLEETGLIVEVGQWALERTVQQCNEWRRAHLEVPRVAVNVSAIQLRKKEFVAEVQRAVAQFQGGCCLDLEITESLIMKDVEENISKLRLLKEAGVNTAIDDFGTGYSSLAYIAKLPVNALKIDRSFVENMSHGPEETGIVFTIISLAHHLDLKVVAEGVESEEQANLLRLLKCDEMQGFLFGKPMLASEVPALLLGRTAVSIIESRAGNALAQECKDRVI